MEDRYCQKIEEEELYSRGRLSNGGVSTRGGRKGVCRRPSPRLVSQSQPSIADEPVLNRGRKRLGVLLQENDVSEERPGSVYDEKKCDVAESVEQDIDVEGLRDEGADLPTKLVTVLQYKFNNTLSFGMHLSGTELLTDAAKLYKQSLGYCFEMEDWGPIEWCVMADHFDRQGKAPYEYHACAKIISRLKAGEEKTMHALKSFCWRCKEITLLMPSEGNYLDGL
ncbi:hypothetical protein POM88_004428 [Heracleum sosnowskyi]|uniref:Uncharacterized protein n=1 Tax=Heracleum sosnowskyi TaxID=360622 RepID=A0AAD8NEG1_9APIA|nr:hypothetical protein POM88_004428 [Heracleum sosnowskyi]